jgi:S-methylmethionine-dependent homocysteine/selenocysteine methylase
MSCQDTPIILDGGFSRVLIRLGAPFAQPEWSALSLLSGSDSHDLVRQAHLEFARAGAEILTTNSYAIVPFHIGEQRWEDRAGELATLAGKLCRDAVTEWKAHSGSEGRGRNLRVAGSLPPIFGSYEPQLFDPTRVQQYLKVLVDGLAPFADFWLGETLSLIAEAEAVRTAVRGKDKPLWIAFTLDDRSSLSENRTVSLRGGETVAQAAEKVASWDDVQAVLFNCSMPEFMLDAVKEVKAVFEKHSCTKMIGVYANRFEPQDDEFKANAEITKLRDDLVADEYVKFARSWVEAGANIVGGCCGVGEDHIEALAKRFANN